MKPDYGCPHHRRKEIINDSIRDTFSAPPSHVVFMCDNHDAPSYYCEVDTSTCPHNPRNKKA